MDAIARARSRRARSRSTVETSSAVGTAEEIAATFTATESVDANGQVVLPGLINTHTHAPMVLYRGLADDLALMEWLQKYIFPAEAKTVTPEFVRVGTRLAALEMIQSGTTTYVDMYYFEEEIARATQGGGTARRPRPDHHPVSGRRCENRRRRPGASRRLSSSEFADDDLITPAFAPHAMYTLDAAMLKSIRAAADAGTRHRSSSIWPKPATKCDRAQAAWRPRRFNTWTRWGCGQPRRPSPLMPSTSRRPTSVSWRSGRSAFRTIPRAT